MNLVGCIRLLHFLYLFLSYIKYPNIHNVMHKPHFKCILKCSLYKECIRNIFCDYLYNIITYIMLEASESASADHHDKKSVLGIGCKNPDRSIPTKFGSLCIQLILFFF